MMLNKQPLILLTLPALIGFSQQLITALAAALILTLLLAGCSLALRPTRRTLPMGGRMILLLIISVTLLSSLSLLLQMHSLMLFKALQPYLPLLVLPCLGLALQAPRTASHCLVLSALLLLMGALREVLGHASLLNNADWLFGPHASAWCVSFGQSGALQLLNVTPGAFIVLGLLIALTRHFLAAGSKRS